MIYVLSASDRSREKSPRNSGPGNADNEKSLQERLWEMANGKPTPTTARPEGDKPRDEFQEKREPREEGREEPRMDRPPPMMDRHDQPPPAVDGGNVFFSISLTYSCNCSWLIAMHSKWLKIDTKIVYIMIANHS